MKYLISFLIIMAAVPTRCQILDMDLDCPLIVSPRYITQGAVDHITITQSGGHAKRDHKKHVNATVAYYFDSVGRAYMKVFHDRGEYVDTEMMNYMRCVSKSYPDSRFYEENLFCNDKGVILANQTDKSKIFYRYDSLERIREWIQIDREEDEESQVFLTKYEYDSIGRLDSIIDKEGALRFNLSIRQLDTIYRTATYRKVAYKDDRITSVLCFASNNLDQIVPVSVYRYKYKSDRLDMIELSPIDDRKVVLYTLKVTWTD